LRTWIPETVASSLISRQGSQAEAASRPLRGRREIRNSLLRRYDRTLSP